MIKSHEQKLYAAIKKADAKGTVLPLGYGEAPELISARGEF